MSPSELRDLRNAIVLMRSGEREMIEYGERVLLALAKISSEAEWNRFAFPGAPSEPNIIASSLKAMTSSTDFRTIAENIQKVVSR